MAKKDADLFDRLRQVGLRKQAAGKALSGVSDTAGKQAQRAARAAVSELRAVADEIERRLPAAAPASGSSSGDSSAATSRARARTPRSTKASAARTQKAGTAKPKRAPRSSTTTRAGRGSRCTANTAAYGEYRARRTRAGYAIAGAAGDLKPHTSRGEPGYELPPAWADVGAGESHPAPHHHARPCFRSAGPTQRRHDCRVAQSSLVRTGSEPAAVPSLCSSCRSGSRPSGSRDHRGLCDRHNPGSTSVATPARCEPRPRDHLPSVNSCAPAGPAVPPTAATQGRANPRRTVLLFAETRARPAGWRTAACRATRRVGSVRVSLPPGPGCCLTPGAAASAPWPLRTRTATARAQRAVGDLSVSTGQKSLVEAADPRLPVGSQCRGDHNLWLVRCRCQELVTGLAISRQAGSSRS